MQSLRHRKIQQLIFTCDGTATADDDSIDAASAGGGGGYERKVIWREEILEICRSRVASNNTHTRRCDGKDGEV